jgi:hypothetical protein
MTFSYGEIASLRDKIRAMRLGLQESYFGRIVVPKPGVNIAQVAANTARDLEALENELTHELEQIDSDTEDSMRGKLPQYEGGGVV